ncbi:MAG TPA: gephyrin-like molybdotransferase Glp [Acidimicrobiales bacterium]|nr:gephyrin-like molybdotransferase Glp [Acidimicrobiales bacterium]
MGSTISVAEARRFVLARCVPLRPLPRAIGDAAMLVLAETVRAPQAVPPFTNSAMDGYAVRAADTVGAPVRLHVVATVMAGNDSTPVVGNGGAARIMTGAQMPPGADSVCMVERTRSEVGGSIVIVEEAVAPGANVRRAGEDIESNTEVFVPGTLLTAPHVGVLASLGIKTVLVYPPPRVGVVSTGDELAAASGALAPGKIHDANRPALLAQLRTDGFEAVDLGMVGDDKTALAQILEDGAATCDAVVATGGVSVGDRDFVKLVLEDLCAPAVWWMHVAVKPARHFAFGTFASTRAPVFGLPGNPVASLVSYELFVRPALRAMAGYRALDRPCLQATTEADLSRHRDGTLHLLRVLAQTGPDGVLRVRLSGGQGSHMLLAMAEANALAVLPDGDGVPVGGQVDVLLLDSDRLRPLDQAGP